MDYNVYSRSTVTLNPDVGRSTSQPQSTQEIQVRRSDCCFVLQIAPSDVVCGERSMAACGDACAASSLAAAAAEVTDNLRIGHVPIVADDNLDICIAALRDALASELPHHISPSPQAIVFSGPFGCGKRRLIQRILSTYPDKFCLPPVYTTSTTGIRGNFIAVTKDFIDDLERKGLLAFKELASDYAYAVSKADVCRYCP